MSGSGLEARVVVDRGDFRLDVELVVPPGTVTALVGPNGAGKTTVLRAIAGLLRPTGGRIVLDGRMLDDAASSRRVPSAGRGIGVVFQDYLLFPHLSALDNVAFGLLARGVPRRDAAASAGEWLDRLGIGGLAGIRPSSLSGGQAQRVALARALVLEPALLLLDEPLAALDAGTRLEVRAELADQLRAFGGSAVVVTHDPVDAIVLADEIVVVEHGGVVQRGTPVDVARNPANEYVATLVGLDLVRLSPVRSVVLSPTEVLVSVERPADAVSHTIWQCRVRGVEELGGRSRVLLESVADGHRFAADLAPRDLPRTAIRIGDSLWATLPFVA
ncbi:ABC transporter ATP-binding protein [Marisediminicola antarctica]|uniref:ABC transporter domain-containing protein n=1 Tax=Marisediminicola antarctica TaxID=674079 RepID=A0A7L5AH14_9MICO|nr:ABC transporter ATP-binding protein [Marisediminicola antarctica]QHO69292.1 hypothetical protein BHD05_06145 [Marisediminicola antarctica]